MSNTRTVIVDGETFEVTIEGDGPTYQVEVGGRTFEVEVPNAGPAPKRRAGGGGKKKRSGTVSANIPGKVVTVEVTEGQHVEEGQVILILEAMKMQNEIQAPVTGTVTSVQCEEGEAIEANVPLVVIEPDPTEDDEDRLSGRSPDVMPMSFWFGPTALAAGATVMVLNSRSSARVRERARVPSMKLRRFAPIKGLPRCSDGCRRDVAVPLVVGLPHARPHAAHQFVVAPLAIAELPVGFSERVGLLSGGHEVSLGGETRGDCPRLSTARKVAHRLVGHGLTLSSLFFKPRRPLWGQVR